MAAAEVDSEMPSPCVLDFAYSYAKLNTMAANNEREWVGMPW